MSEKLWYKVARTMIKAGGRMPFPITDTLFELLKTLLTEDQAKFLLSFKNPSMNINQLKDKTGMDETELVIILKELMYNGIIVGAPSRRTGIMVYRLMPLAPAGIVEFTFMRGKKTEKEKKLVKLFDKLYDELRQLTQKNYDKIIPQYKILTTPFDRVVPVEEEIEVPKEEILPYYEVSKIIDKYDDISVSHCYCRHEKDLLGEPCKITNERLNCLMFGKSARFAIKNDFGKRISKEKAKKIIKKAEEEGLIHKAFHIHSNTNNDEEALCNCCKCCCGLLQLYYKGCFPISTISSHIAIVNEDECVGCSTCIEKCPVEAITLKGDIANINSEKCIGCGVCAHFCTSNAIKLEYNKRSVFISPLKLTTS